MLWRLLQEVGRLLEDVLSLRLGAGSAAPPGAAAGGCAALRPVPVVGPVLLGAGLELDGGLRLLVGRRGRRGGSGRDLGLDGRGLLRPRVLRRGLLGERLGLLELLVALEDVVVLDDGRLRLPPACRLGRGGRGSIAAGSATVAAASLAVGASSEGVRRAGPSASCSRRATSAASAPWRRLSSRCSRMASSSSPISPDSLPGGDDLVLPGALGLVEGRRRRPR